MCLGVPGRIEEIAMGDDLIFRTGKVSFGGVLRDICLAGVSDARVGDWVIVHAGFALSKLNEEEAFEVFEYLRQISEYGKKELKDDPNILRQNDIPEEGTK